MISESLPHTHPTSKQLAESPHDNGFARPRSYMCRRVPNPVTLYCDWTNYGLPKPSEDVHIDANRLIRDNREWLRFRAETLGHAVFHIENISAGR